MTTSVVIIAVFLFGLFFFIVDNIFSAAYTKPHGILSKLGGMHRAQPGIDILNGRRVETTLKVRRRQL